MKFHCRIGHNLAISGRINSGDKILTEEAKKHPKAVDLYERGVASGVSFDEILRYMRRIEGIPKTPLRPRNTPWFVVRHGDFSIPESAQTLMELYGETRGDDADPHLYSFPVIFPSNDISLVLEESFQAWKGGKLNRWSQADATGVVQCTTKGDLEPGKRRWGGRPEVALRECDPNDCDLFGRGDCRHYGSLRFWIPGVRGAGLIELNFTSIYASLGIAETLNVVKQGLGHIAGIHDNRPIFRLSKVQRSVSRIDWDTGKSLKTTQHIIVLDAELDMMDVLMHSSTGSGEQRMIGTNEDVAMLPVMQDEGKSG